MEGNIMTLVLTHLIVLVFAVLMAKLLLRFAPEEPAEGGGRLK